MNYTPAQREAIESRNSNLLVSAAAGSGKTAVLAARIVSLAREGVPLDRMLVMTFTRSAAAEMRARILESLYREGLREQALRVERADITTLHGFCGQVCRAYFEAAGVDPMFRVGEGPEMALLGEAALSDALEELYAAPTPGFAYAALALTREEIENAVAALRGFLLARPDPWRWLSECLKRFDASADELRDTPWAKCLFEQAEAELKSALAAARREADFAAQTGLYGPLAQNDLSLVESLRALAAESPETLAANSTPAFARKPPKQKNADPDAELAFGRLRDECKASVARALDALSPLRDPADCARNLRESKSLLSGLADAAARFDALFAEKKAEKNLLDFTDLETRALQALRDERAVRDVREKYRYVFIDEYQDSSLLQEALIERVRGETNLFLVGDVKQSIYRFRLAQPGLFLARQRDSSRDPGAKDRNIPLSANFRSDPAVLSAVNAVFARVFTGGAMELDYPPPERLVPGNPDAPAGAKPELLVLCGDMDDESADADELSPREREKVRQEAEVIARRIETLRNEDPSLRLRDIAVLMRSVKGRAHAVIDVLRAHGMPAVTELGEDLLAQPETLAALALLRVMDNARQDIPLLAALRGPALGFDDAALARIRARTPDGPFEAAARAYLAEDDALARALEGFYTRIERWAEDARVLPLERMLYRIYDETGLYAAAGAKPQGARRQNMLRMLAELAQKYDAEHGGDLSGFLRMVERIAARESLEARALAEDEDVIRVTTIHKSKGLQYPVVFVAGCGNRFGAGRKKSLLFLHEELGVAAPAMEPYLRVESETLATRAIATRLRAQSVAEEARVLYVALTRPERRLFAVGTASAAQLARWKENPDAPSESANCLLDWLYPAASHGEEWLVEERGFAPLARPEPDVASVDCVAPLLAAQDTPAVETVARMCAESPRATPHPLKQGVTARIRLELRAGEEEALPRLCNAPRRPAFLEEEGLTGAERGSAVHAFLQRVRVGTTDAAAERDRALSLGGLTQREADALPLGLLDAFFAGPLWRRMAQAQTLRRELPFSLRAGEGAGRILLQGVIDCCFLENGQWVLVDYKTEAREPEPETMRLYFEQIRCYASALETVSGQRVKECLLCFVLQGKTIDVPRETNSIQP